MLESASNSKCVPYLAVSSCYIIYTEGWLLARAALDLAWLYNAPTGKNQTRSLLKILMLK